VPQSGEEDGRQPEGVEREGPAQVVGDEAAQEVRQAGPQRRAWDRCFEVYICSIFYQEIGEKNTSNL
jgi:lipase chaperone LimK